MIPVKYHIKHSNSKLGLPVHKASTVEPPCPTTPRKQPPPVHDHLPKLNTETFPSHKL